MLTNIENKVRVAPVDLRWIHSEGVCAALACWRYTDAAVVLANADGGVLAHRVDDAGRLRRDGGEIM
jgi:hypothetical protein